MTYAEIRDGECVNVVEADASFARLFNMVEVPDGYGIGDYFFSGEWSHDPDPEPTTEDILNALLGVTE